MAQKASVPAVATLSRDSQPRIAPSILTESKIGNGVRRWTTMVLMASEEVLKLLTTVSKHHKESQQAPVNDLHNR